jgi:polyisoprenoid-binding protein YceI
MRSPASSGGAVRWSSSTRTPGRRCNRLFRLLVILAQGIPASKLVSAEIWFDARASIADFQGRATVATGTLEWVEVRWEDIDTKNGTRNGHMLKTVDADRFPVIRFDVSGVRAGGDSVAGTLALHGVTRQVVWRVSMQDAADTVKVAADFPVDMRDYGIKPPVRFVIARMGAVVTVHVRLVFAKR